MQPWLMSFAAPIAANAVQSLGQAALTTAEPFAAVLDRAIGGQASAANHSDCEGRETDSPLARLERRLHDLLAPLTAGAPAISLLVNSATGEIEVDGDSPTAHRIRQAVAEDSQLRDDLLSVAAEETPAAGTGPLWPRFFAATRADAPVRLQWDGARLTTA